MASNGMDSAPVRSHSAVRIPLVRYFNVSSGIKDVTTEQTGSKK